MAHYAFLDKDNIVTEVIVGIDETETIEGLNPEVWYGKLRGQDCKRTSYNGTIRANYAAVGYKYDSEFDVFIAPQPHPSWKLNYTTYQWEPPVVQPEDDGNYIRKWSEYNKEWIKQPYTKATI
jgi:hypothetical protein